MGRHLSPPLYWAHGEREECVMSEQRDAPTNVIPNRFMLLENSRQATNDSESLTGWW